MSVTLMNLDPFQFQVGENHMTVVVKFSCAQMRQTFIAFPLGPLGSATYKVSRMLKKFSCS